MTADGFAPSHRWDLESLYPGGAGGEAITTLLEQLESSLTSLLGTFNELPALDRQSDAQQAWADALLQLETTFDGVYDAWSLSHCAASADVDDAAAKVLMARMADLLTTMGQIDVPLRAKLAEADKPAFDELCGREDLSHMAFYLGEERARAEISMEPKLEELQVALARDGFHSWGRLYETVSGALRVQVDRGDGPEALSVEQARNLLESPDTALREHVAEAIHNAWDTQKEVLAAALNHINGYRHTVYARRGIDELELPVRNNRIGRQTLETMFESFDGFRSTMARFLRAKAKLLGLERLRWFDVNVPLGKSGESVSYEQAQQTIVSEFTRFSPALGEFAEMAFRNSWIEAEDRSGKRHGGFCTSFPLHKQSRIFMTFGRTPGSVQTLAHELGHAYHSWVMRDLPGRQRDYPMTLAETASTFAESIIRQAAFREATDEQVKLGILDRHLTDAATMVMNIPARYHFDRAMFAERGKHELPPERLTELVVESFDRCFDGELAEYERLFWASKLHFYLSEAPFYNFPYSVGYLFSTGLFARAQKEGADFAPKYDETLRLTGSNTVEAVANRALGVDLGEVAFWQNALQSLVVDIDAFVELSESLAGD